MIRMNQLDFSYRKKNVFSGLNLTLSEGHVYGLLGKNGAGKSTLLKLMCGLLFPERGEINVMGYLPSARKPAFLSELFFIPEEIYLPDLKMSAYAELLRPFYPRFDRQMLEEYMEEFEVSLDERMSRMSYGQRKKALICLGLACNTRLLVMDEPTNGLDIPSKSHFRRLIASVATKDRCIIIQISFLNKMAITDMKSLTMQKLDMSQNTILLTGRERIILVLDWELPHLLIISVFRM